MRQREDTYLEQKAKERDIDQTFLRNVGYKAQSSTRATLEPQGTIFDNIYKAKPPKARLQSQTVMEQKRQLEELRKAAENKPDDRRSLLELNVLMKSEDHLMKMKTGCAVAAATQREQINEKIRSHL